MSNRNNQQNKQAARERLRAEREKQAKKEKVRRQLVVGGSIVAVLAVAGGIGVAVANMGGGSENSEMSGPEWRSAAAKKTYAQPANTTGDKGTAIVIGDEKAKETIDLYEDPRCPACATFEQLNGKQVDQDTKDARYKVRFVLVNFIDDIAGGSGSKNAVSALGAALNVSPQAFLDYKTALFTKDNHPEERDDQYSNDKKLLEIAKQVPALKGNQKFEKAVKDGTYDKWALEMGKLFKKNNIQGTPALMHNGEKVTVNGKDTPMAPEDYIKVMDEKFPKK
ncbi:thioredoxin domain-containing protein [Streptomyces zagrosensis]|uniref:Protein-disulfide isomerase n=1 Tax=Streptomyces zagrosensis TaxID=1042984 RepID=A0A7W9Q4W9_9ACTN|nr:thioredoxin domain-containing protein [Streptomyces zagrosensis]MBB5933501.1 protein-disulfide isomerase [Streptomyces zagrosensis]